MTQEQIDKKRVRDILREYFKTPGATLENDVFVAMVKAIQDTRKQAQAEVLRELRRWYNRQGSYGESVENFATEYGITLEEK